MLPGLYKPGIVLSKKHATKPAINAGLGQNFLLVDLRENFFRFRVGGDEKKKKKSSENDKSIIKKKKEIFFL